MNNKQKKTVDKLEKAADDLGFCIKQHAITENAAGVDVDMDIESGKRRYIHLRFHVDTDGSIS